MAFNLSAQYPTERDVDSTYYDSQWGSSTDLVVFIQYLFIVLPAMAIEDLVSDVDITIDFLFYVKSCKGENS